MMKLCCHLGFTFLYVCSFLDIQALSLDSGSTVPFFPISHGTSFAELTILSLPLELYTLNTVSYCSCYKSCCVFSLCRHLWIYAAGLPVRTRARVSKLEPRLDASALLAGLVLTAMCPMSPVKWQLHKGVNKHLQCFN